MIYELILQTDRFYPIVMVELYCPIVPVYAELTLTVWIQSAYYVKCLTINVLRYFSISDSNNGCFDLEKTLKTLI